MMRSEKLNTLDITIIVVIAVINGVLGTYWTAVWSMIVAMGPVGFLVEKFNGGFYSIGAVMCMLIIRKRGVALLAGTLTGVAEVLSGNMWGMIVYLYGITEGAGIEAVFALWGYKKFGAVQGSLGQILGMAFWRLMDIWLWSYWLVPLWLVGAGYIISPFIAGPLWAVIAIGLVNALVKTGVLDAFPVAHDKT
jgi:energy-coupling factor transport system substrate-specific component